VATLLVLAGSSWYLLAGVVGTRGGWGAIGASWQGQLEQAVLLCFKVGRRFGSHRFLGAASALAERCSRPRYARRLNLRLWTAIVN